MKSSLRLAYSSAIALCLLSAMPALAQDTLSEGDLANEPGTRLDEIVVTGRKRARAEALQRVPVSITALSSIQLERSITHDLIDVGRLTPNAALQPSAQRGVQNFAIRGMGVSGSTPSDEPAVGIFQDGVYWGSNYGSLNELFDVEGVEILRGPQGTLFGRNVTGGAVTFRSARPAQQTSYKGMFGVGNGLMFEGSSVINGALMPDTLAGRVAALVRRNEGLFKNGNTGRDYGQSTTILVRPSLRWTPQPGVDVTLLGEYYHAYGDPVAVRGVSPNTVPGGALTLPEREGFVTPADWFTVSPGTVGHSDIQTWFTALEANIEVGPGTLTSITGYRKIRSRNLTDFDGTPSAGFLQNVLNDQHQWSSELRYAADFSEWLSGTAGLYYFDQKFAYGETRDLNNHASLLATRSTLSNSSFAGFAEFDLKPLPGLSVTLGGRYTHETKTATSARFGACTFDLVTCTFAGPARYSANNFAPKAGIAYRFDDSRMIFASVTRGFRSGGFALRGTALASPYRAEKVTAWEAGLKTDWLDRRLRINLSGYINTFTDLQRTVLASDPNLGVIQSVFNAANARIEGAEIEVSVIPVRGFTLAANYGYTRARFRSYIGAANPGALRFVRVPEHQTNLSADYEHELGGGAKAGLHVDGAYTSRYFYDDPNLLSQKGYWLLNANAYYRTANGMTFTVYGRNLAETKYAYWGSSLGGLGQNLFVGDPATYGARISIEF